MGKALTATKSVRENSVPIVAVSISTMQDESVVLRRWQRVGGLPYQTHEFVLRQTCEEFHWEFTARAALLVERLHNGVEEWLTMTHKEWLAKSTRL
jgi:hypothetical protein